jgi:hypothetical protein
MIRISVDVEGVVEAVGMLDGMESRAHDLTPIWQHVAQTFQGLETRAFGSEGATTGAPWPQLAKRTQMQRAKLGFPPAHPILERRGTLKRALTTGQGAYVRTSPTSLEYLLSSEVGYFKFHQLGTGRMPRRAPVRLTRDDITALALPIRFYITGRDLNAPRRQAVG